jgi:hypothetical protein
VTCSDGWPRRHALSVKHTTQYSSLQINNTAMILIILMAKILVICMNDRFSSEMCNKLAIEHVIRDLKL